MKKKQGLQKSPKHGAPKCPQCGQLATRLQGEFHCYECDHTFTWYDVEHPNESTFERTLWTLLDRMGYSRRGRNVIQYDGVIAVKDATAQDLVNLVMFLTGESAEA